MVAWHVCRRTASPMSRQHSLSSQCYVPVMLRRRGTWVTLGGMAASIVEFRLEGIPRATLWVCSVVVGNGSSVNSREGERAGFRACAWRTRLCPRWSLLCQQLAVRQRALYAFPADALACVLSVVVGGLALLCSGPARLQSYLVCVGEPTYLFRSCVCVCVCGVIR